MLAGLLTMSYMNIEIQFVNVICIEYSCQIVNHKKRKRKKKNVCLGPYF